MKAFEQDAIDHLHLAHSEELNSWEIDFLSNIDGQEEELTDAQAEKLAEIVGERCGCVA